MKNKNSKKNNTVKSKKSNKVAAETQVAAPIEQVAQVAATIKRGRGRPMGAVSSNLVSLETLIKSLPATTRIPVSAKFLKLLNIAPESSFVSTPTNLTQVVKAATPGVQVQDLNQEAVV